MLVMSRATGETLCVGDGVQVSVLEVRGSRVRLGVEAPRGFPVLRKEFFAPAIDARKRRRKKARAKLMKPRGTTRRKPWSWVWKLVTLVFSVMVGTAMRSFFDLLRGRLFGR
jgi:carbon storage regulator